jgi:hypothetical protein
MTNFESLEDSFLKKSSEQLSTDYQEAQKRQQTLKSEQEPKEDDKYENKIKQKDIRVGLAALLEEKIKQSRDPNQVDKDNTEEDTVFFSSSAIRYEDTVAIPNTEVDEDDIQRFYPHEKYNDVYTAPETTIKDGGRYEGKNRYGDMLQPFEPNTASAEDIQSGRSVSSITAPGEPSMNPTRDEVLNHIHENNLKNSSDNLGPSEKPNYEETELSREEHEAYLRNLQENNSDNE